MQEKCKAGAQRGRARAWPAQLASIIYGLCTAQAATTINTHCMLPQPPRPPRPAPTLLTPTQTTPSATGPLTPTPTCADVFKHLLERHEQEGALAGASGGPQLLGQRAVVPDLYALHHLLLLHTLLAEALGAAVGGSGERESEWVGVRDRGGEEQRSGCQRGGGGEEEEEECV